jgi:hypothetical protein
VRIESVVSRGKFKGEVQTPDKDSDGYFVLCHSKYVEDKIRVPDLESVANGLRAGLRVRMASASVPFSMRKPDQVTLEGMSVRAYFSKRGDRF